MQPVDKQQTLGHIEHYFVTVEPKKVNQVLEKSTQSAWSALWSENVVAFNKP